MARTVQEIFDKAIHLIDAQGESSGSTETSDTKEYKVRCCELLNTRLNECYPFSDTYAETADPFLAGELYGRGDVVTWCDGKYLCIIASGSTTAEPTDTTAWQKAATAKAGRRPTLEPVNAMTDYVEMDDFICLSVLPNGLACEFLSEENPTLSNFFQQRYEELLARAKGTLPAGAGDDGNGFEDIVNPYGGFSRLRGGIEHGQFGSWPW